MSLSGEDSRALAAIERHMSASAPRLTAMLATFTLLTRDEQMPNREQLAPVRGWLLTAVIVALMAAVTTFASFRSTQWISEAPRTVYSTVLHLSRSLPGYLMAASRVGAPGR